MENNDLGASSSEDRAIVNGTASVPAVPASVPSADELWETLCYLGKWVERGLFCKTVTAGEALSMIAHYPGMPWNSRRWDVDHKPYAAAYYAKFPKTAAQGTEARSGETSGSTDGDGPVSKPCAPGGSV